MSAALAPAARIAVIGGGLAGLAAAVALVERGLNVELFETRRKLGGRAASFTDPATAESVDHCQHVSMGCCTNLIDFCQRVGIRDRFRDDKTLHFFGIDGRRFNFRASEWLPAPLHLAPGLFGLSFLSLWDRLSIARALHRMAALPDTDDPRGPTIGQWLRANGQSEVAIEQFWSVVLVSALSETVDRASLRYARKVFVDGFMTNRNGYVVEVPVVSLSELYGTGLEGWFGRHHVPLHCNAHVSALETDQGRVDRLRFRDGAARGFDHFIIATPWRQAATLLRTAGQDDIADRLDRLEPAPITGVHLWFDRQITDLPHAVLVGRTSQWMFRRPHVSGRAHPELEHYYQVVISASRALAGQDRAVVIAKIVSELAETFPLAAEARLIQARLVTEAEAVFSPRPGVDRLRPAAETSLPNLFLAGDWTATGWPATMEGAVRSGYLAAEALLRRLDRAAGVVVPDLPRSLLSRMVIRPKPAAV